MSKSHKDEITSVKENQDFELSSIKRKHEKIINELTESHFQKIEHIHFKTRKIN